MDDAKQQPVGNQIPSLPQIPTQPRPQQFTPVSGPHKEFQPQQAVVEAPVAEYVTPHASEVEPQLHPEVKEAGVETVEQGERPQLSVEHKAAGVEHAKEATPVTIAQTQSVQLPYTQVQIQEMKKEPTSEGKHWLAVFTEYLIKKLQLS